ncbi:MAG TPA: CBS domain-containing protein [Burkholderiales bacterium]|nr:CBS domain-containing protein [Burkholderiales bacterium]
MSIGDVCNREVVFTRKHESVLSAAALMREHHVGSLVVVDEQGGKRIPVGIITDRDVAVGVVALGLDADLTRVDDAMGPEIVCAREDTGVAECVALMRQKGLRRLPVVDASGALIGLVAADDLLELLGEEISGLAAIVARERTREQVRRRAAP